MASMNLNGPHRLNYDEVTSIVGARSPGVFALGYNGKGGVFFVNYIGRSDDDVRRRLLDFVGSDVAFKFKQLASAQEAFVLECELYHTFRPRSNRLHPGRPALSGWTCPKCGRLENHERDR